MFSLGGKTALVTGGGSGLGRAIAEALSNAGAHIALVGRRKALLDEALGERTGITISADLMADDATEIIRKACEQANLQPQIIVNAAGLNPRKPADTISLADWNHTIHLNLTVPFLMAQAFVPGMKAHGWGRILNIASLQSERAFTNGIAYGASKGGVTQLTRAMAEAWSPAGINCNALQPGFFPTELTGPVFADEALTNHHAKATCIGRNGALDDIKGPALFLCSPASDYVTGHILAVDGGYTAK